MVKEGESMTLEQELVLSEYRQVADIQPDHGISLVQHVRTGKFYVKKHLTVYSATVYRQLWARPVPNTPRIYYVAEDAAGLTVIEEYIPGDTLEEILKARRVLTEGEVISITRQLCRILQAFHNGTPAIVNRDIKPSNIKISPDGVVKLVDLNAAKWIRADARKDTVLLGTPGYAAPEQYGFGPSNVLTDIYGVGVLMNEMCTGGLPGRINVEGRLGKVIRKCVELSPDARYQSMDELLAALDKLGQPEKQPSGSGSWRRFLPPGFRGDNVLVWLLSGLGYFLLLDLSASMGGKTSMERTLSGIFFGAMAFGIILFTGNYLGIQSQFPLTRSPRLWLRILGILLVDGVIALVCIFSLGVIMTW